MHYGTKPGHFETSKMNFPMSEGVSEQTSERSRGHKRSEQSRAREQVSGVSDRTNGRASGPALTSLFFFVSDHSAMANISLGWFGPSLFAFVFLFHRFYDILGISLQLFIKIEVDIA